MDQLIIFDPSQTDPLGQFRGGGRIIQILKENFPEAKFIKNLNQLSNYHLCNGRFKDGNWVFINPIFNPFQPPLTLKKITKKQIQIIFDVIPLKYPKHFPIGIKGKFNLWLNKLALRNYDKIITISHHSKRDIIHYLKIPEERIEVVYPTIGRIFLNSNKQAPITKKNLNSKHQAPNSKQIQNSKQKSFGNCPPQADPPLAGKLKTENYCLYVGDVNWNKNLVNLAKAIKIINVTCVFAGKAFDKLNSNNQAPITKPQSRTSSLRGRQNQNSNLFPISNFQFLISNLNHPWQQEFKDFLKEVSGDKRFIFLGYVDDYRLIKLYQQARLNILISRDEGFGFSFLEAASQGCPSVLSNIPVFHEIAGDSAWFANPENPYDIADKIGEIYFNKQLRDQLGFKAQKKAKFFNEQKLKNKLKLIIKKL